MGADVSIEHEGHPCHMSCFHADMSITRNLTKMMLETGLPYWDEVEGMPAKDYSELLQAAVLILLESPEKFYPFEPENGWGSYDTMLRAFTTFGQDTAGCQFGTVSVWY